MTGSIILQKTEAMQSLNKEKFSWQSNSYGVKILYSDIIKIISHLYLRDSIVGMMINHMVLSYKKRTIKSLPINEAFIITQLS